MCTPGNWHLHLQYHTIQCVKQTLCAHDGAAFGLAATPTPKDLPCAPQHINPHRVRVRSSRPFV